MKADQKYQVDALRVELEKAFLGIFSRSSKSIETKGFSWFSVQPETKQATKKAA